MRRRKADGNLGLACGICVSFLVLMLFGVGCAGRVVEVDNAQRSTTVITETTGSEDAETTAGGEPVGVGQQETADEEPFVLNTEQPVPPDFLTAYRRGTRIVVEFYGRSADGFYPQGLGPDESGSSTLEGLRGEYPAVEFFSYNINDPGDVGAAANGEATLEPGQYGTLTAQLNVGYTPFVATMAPSGDGYLILNRFQGYTPPPVLSQALYDLDRIEVEDNASDVVLELNSVRLTDTGGGIEYFTVSNPSESRVDLQGFSLREIGAEGEITSDSPGVSVDEAIEVPTDGVSSIGRVPDALTDEGETVDGTFTGGDRLELVAGDQVALLDSGGAVVATLSVS
ncbi:hypothetical protein [Rubrobacter indicoceani]|uniref:hypothetical protein n=1 Tax=Rubrobacter indicoceani TaxID=2051957 RepID=UPI0013C4707A|nr:hypothetical protein [Rubrobacter indicoceani]